MSFDRIAPFYRSLESLAFGDQLQRARLACLGETEAPGRVLIIGEGDGRFLAEFVRLYPNAEVDCVDASARMINIARAWLGARHRVNFILADIRNLPLAPQRYDLIVTHFFLDCFAGVALHEVVQKLACAATAKAAWLLADFRQPAIGWRWWHARFWLAVMYRFFALASGLETEQLVDPSPYLAAADFSCARQQLARFGMIKSELWRRSID